MTRHIRPHKGGRTARAPEARIRPQTLQRIRATMQERRASFADLLEEQYSTGDDRMNARDQLFTYINTHNNDELQRTDIVVLLKRIDADQQAAIAAAVAAEREACAKVADEEVSIWSPTSARNDEAATIAAAIRARGNGRE